MASHSSSSSRGRSCLADLDDLCTKLRDPNCKYLDQISPSAMEDESRRFMVWATNIGALQGPQKRSSLDYRLREAPQVRQQVIRLLERLSLSAKQASSICAGRRPNRVENDSDLDDKESSDALQAPGKRTSEVSEIRELFLAISGSVTRLFKLSMVIRNPIPRDRYERLASVEPLSSLFDIRHVREKFPKVEKHLWLAERLGKANAQRRDYFRYRRRHKEKLAKEAEEYERRLNEQPRPAEKQEGQHTRKEDNTSRSRRAQSSLGSTKASTYVPPPNNLQKLEEASDTGQSETSYATSVEEEKFKALHVPPPPAEFDDGLPFECPYCYTIQSPSNRQAWKKHVFNDLQPYTCTFESCSAKLFASRHTWFDHELQVHRKEWVCSLCKHSAFQSSGTFRLHLQNYHHEEVTDRQIPTMIDLCAEPLDKMRPEDCLLCSDWASSIRKRELVANPKAETSMLVVTHVQFRRHLAAHLEQLALFALPRHHGGEDTSKVDSNGAIIDASSDDISVANLSADGSDGIEENEVGHPLYLATVSGQVDEVRKLLEAGADANARGKDHDYVLQAAALLGLYPIAKLLVEHGADVNSPAGPTGTAIQAARSEGHRDIVDLLLKFGADSGDENSGRQQSTSQQDSIENALFLFARTWRQIYSQRGNIRTFEDAAWIVHKFLRNRKVGYHSLPDAVLDNYSKPIALERIWGQLFDEQSQPTRRLDQFLLGIALYLIEDYEPRNSIVISPEKMRRFYREMQLDSELYPWERVFDDRISFISRLYRELGIQHHLIQENRLDERPDVPSLTPLGFSTWMTILLLSYPLQEWKRLRKVALEYPISNADDRKEILPKELPERNLPKAPNHALRKRLHNALTTQCGIFLPTGPPHDTNSQQSDSGAIPGSRINQSQSSGAATSEPARVDSTEDVFQNLDQEHPGRSTHGTADTSNHLPPEYLKELTSEITQNVLRRLKESPLTPAPDTNDVP